MPSPIHVPFYIFSKSLSLKLTKRKIYVPFLHTTAAFISSALLFEAGLVLWQHTFISPHTAAYLTCNFNCSCSFFPGDIVANVFSQCFKISKNQSPESMHVPELTALQATAALSPGQSWSREQSPSWTHLWVLLCLSLGCPPGLRWRLPFGDCFPPTIYLSAILLFSGISEFPAKWLWVPSQAYATLSRHGDGAANSFARCRKTLNTSLRGSHMIRWEEWNRREVCKGGGRLHLCLYFQAWALEEMEG